MPRETRYYNGVASERTTTYSAVGSFRRGRPRRIAVGIALALAVVASVGAGAAPRTPLERHVPFFPLEVLWTMDLLEPVLDGAVTDGRRIFVAARAGEVHALDLLSGGELWKVVSPSVAPLAVGDGLVFVQSAHALVALAAADGDIRWSIQLDEALAGPVTWHAGRLLLPTAAGELIALHAAHGIVVWRQPLGSAVRGHPAGDGGSVVFASLDDGRLVALDMETGRQLWMRALGGGLSDPYASGGRVYIGSTSNVFYALNAKHGGIDWTWRTGGDVTGPAGGDQDRIYFASLDNVIRAVARGSGNQQWRKALPTRPAGGPVVADQTVVIAGIAPELHGFGAPNGESIGSYTSENDFAGPPLFRVGAPVTEAAVVLVSRAGVVQALRPRPPLPIEDPEIVPLPFDRRPFLGVADPPLVPLPVPLPGRLVRPGH